MSRAVSLTIATAVAFCILGFTPVLAAEPAKKLPTAYEAELKAAKKVRFGQRVKVAAACVPSIWKCQRYQPMVVTVRSMTPGTKEGWPDGTPTFNLDVKVENRTKGRNGLIPMIRCANEQGKGSWYQGSVDVGDMPSRSRQEGTVIVSFPPASGDLSAPAIKPSECVNAVIWLEPSPTSFTFTKKEAKKAKMPSDAYIPLPKGFLATLPSTHVSSTE